MRDDRQNDLIARLEEAVQRLKGIPLDQDRVDVIEDVVSRLEWIANPGSFPPPAGPTIVTKPGARPPKR
jgi:hypothetical protein